MIIHDISISTSPATVTWNGTETGFSFAHTQRVESGAVCTLSVLTDGVHTGTHLDAPAHFVPGGRTNETLDVNVLVGPCQVVEIFGRDSITAVDCDAADIPTGTTRILFKTDNTRRALLSDPAFHSDYVGIAPSAATWLVQHSVSLVGIDYLSAGPYGDADAETHHILLGAGIVIVETLDLSSVTAGDYTLAALPPKFVGLEGSPCRAILMQDLDIPGDSA